MPLQWKWEPQSGVTHLPACFRGFEQAEGYPAALARARAGSLPGAATSVLAELEMEVCLQDVMSHIGQAVRFVLLSAMRNGIVEMQMLKRLLCLPFLVGVPHAHRHPADEQVSV